MTKVHAGKMYGQRHDGTLVPVTDNAVPDFIICRRLEDFGSRVPARGTVGQCSRCQTPIVFNAAKFPDKPRVCMQCARIAPLPLDGPEAG